MSVEQGLAATKGIAHMFDAIGTNVLSLPRLVLAHPYPEYQTLLASAFRRRGWDVYLARSGPEARQLVHLLDADAAVLHVDLCEESGWLTCDKLTRDRSLAHIVLVGDKRNRRNRELAVFVGARALLDCSEDIVPLIEEMSGLTLPAAS
jgi:CheY-like chemotaxis protein